MTYKDPAIFVVDALIASMVASPQLPGLSFNELEYLGAKHKLYPGEIGPESKQYGVSRQAPDKIGFAVSKNNADCFYGHWEVSYQPEFRNLNAIRFIMEFFFNRWRSEGLANLGVPKDMLIAEAVKQGIKEDDVDLAISLMLLSERVIDMDGLIKPNEVPTKQDFSQRDPNLNFPCTVKQLLPDVRALIDRR